MLELHLENPKDFEDPLQHSIGFYRAKLLQNTTFFPPCVCARKDFSSVAGSMCVCAREDHCCKKNMCVSAREDVSSVAGSMCACARKDVSSIASSMCVSAIERFWPHPTPPSQTTKDDFIEIL